MGYDQTGLAAPAGNNRLDVTASRRVCLPLYPTLTLPRFFGRGFRLDYNRLQIIVGLIGAASSAPRPARSP